MKSPRKQFTFTTGKHPTKDGAYLVYGASGSGVTMFWVRYNGRYYGSRPYDETHDNSIRDWNSAWYWALASDIKVS